MKSNDAKPRRRCRCAQAHIPLVPRTILWKGHVIHIHFGCSRGIKREKPRSDESYDTRYLATTGVKSNGSTSANEQAREVTISTLSRDFRVTSASVVALSPLRTPSHILLRPSLPHTWSRTRFSLSFGLICASVRRGILAAGPRVSHMCI